MAQSKTLTNVRYRDKLLVGYALVASSRVKLIQLHFMSF